MGHSAQLCMDFESQNTTQGMTTAEYIYFVFYYCPSGGYMI